MKNQIRAQMSSTNIITMDDRKGWKMNTKFRKKRTYPTEFSNSGGNKAVFGFCGGTSDPALFL